VAVTDDVSQRRTRDLDFGAGTDTLIARIRAAAAGLKAMEAGELDAAAGTGDALVSLSAAAAGLAELLEPPAPRRRPGAIEPERRRDPYRPPPDHPWRRPLS
jgi:hypothetical protein